MCFDMLTSVERFKNRLANAKTEGASLSIVSECVARPVALSLIVQKQFNSSMHFI